MRLVFALLALVACGDSAPPARTEVSIAPAPTATATASATASVAPVASSATPDASAAAVLDELHEGMADGGLVVLGALQGGPDVRAAIGVDGGAPFGSGTLTTGFGGGGSGSGSGRIHGSAGTHASHVRQGATAVSGSMPPEIIRRVVRAHYGHVRACYAKGIQKNPALQGRIEVKFVIDRSGRVSSAVSTLRSNLPDSAVVSCVVSAFRSMRFPSPQGGVVTVIYPLIFAPAN